MQPLRAVGAGDHHRGGDDLGAGPDPDLVDGQGGRDHVAGPQRVAVGEALVAVHDPAQGQLQLGVVEHRLPGRGRRSRRRRSAGRSASRRRSAGCRHPGPRRTRRSWPRRPRTGRSAGSADRRAPRRSPWVKTYAEPARPRAVGTGRSTTPAARSPERLDQRPAALGGQGADRVEQQAVGQEQRQDRHRLAAAGPAPRPAAASQVANAARTGADRLGWPAARPGRRPRRWRPGWTSRPRSSRTEASGADPGVGQAGAEQVGDVVTGAEDVGHHELDPGGLGGRAYGLRARRRWRGRRR